MKSWSTKCVAVRKVTQDNQGKKTAGVDGVKALTPPQRQHLVQTLQLTEQALPTRRVWIPKPNSTEKRPLGIPTIRTRAEQTLVKLALEPEWEAQFEPTAMASEQAAHAMMRLKRSSPPSSRSRNTSWTPIWPNALIESITKPS